MNDIITLDLHHSADAKEFRGTDLIHPDELNNVIRWIDQYIDQAEEASKSKTEKSREHNTITVLGTRGSGKTSFLLSTLEKFKADNSRAAVIKIIDPTLIEDKGHVFLFLVSIIKEMVEAKQSLVSFDPQSADYQDHAKWQTLILSLSHGLPSIDGIGTDLHANSWQDPEYIMEKGITAVSSARKLEENFNTIISEALRILKKSVFIIAFDDIDIDYKKGWPVLETIRKYLTSPQLVILLSGDMKLYSLVIRKQQWSNLGNDFLKYEADAREKQYKISNAVTEMETQYLLKVMKPERRVHLKTLNEKIVSLNKAGALYVKLLNGSTLPLEDQYDDILSRFGIHNSYQAEVYRTFFLSSPLRLQLRFLSVFDTGNKNNDNDSYRDVLLSYLLDKNVDITLATSAPKFLNVAILQLLLQEKALADQYQLQPSTTDVSMNGALTLLSFMFSKSSENNSDLIFDYLIKVGYTRNLLSLLGYSSSAGNITSNTPSIEGLFKHAGILRDQVLKDTTGLLIAYMTAYFNTGPNERYWAGTVELNAFNETRKQGANVIGDRFDIVLNNEPSRAKTFLAYYPLTVSKHAFHQQNFISYSVYTLLGTIGELIKKARHKDLKRGLLELSQVRTYPMPDFKRGSDSRAVNEVETIDTDENIRDKEEDLSELEGLISQWVTDFPGIAVSPHILGKIATRVYYALDAIHEEKPKPYLGQAIHFRIITIMNSILIEDVKENVKSPEWLIINNSRYSDRIFNINLRRASAEQYVSSLQFSKWMLSCPLLIAYLDSTSEELIGNITAFTSHDSAEAFNFSVYDILEQISVKGASAATSNDLSEKLEARIRELEKVGVPRAGLISGGSQSMDNSEINARYKSKYGKRVSNLNILRDYVTKQQLS